MAITFLGSVNGASGNGGNVTLDLSGLGLQDGDLVLVAGAVGDNDNVDLVMSLMTSGYTKVADLHADDSQDCDLGVWWKVMGASPDTSVVVDGQGGTDAAVAAVAMVFRGVDPTTPMDVTPATATGINGNRPNPPSLDHGNPSGVWTVAVGAFGHTSGAGVTATAPSGYQDVVVASGNDTSDVTVAMAYRTAPADPEDPGIFTPSIADSTGHAWCAVTIALRPAVVAATFAGAVTGTGTATGALTTAITCAGALVASATVTGDLGTAITAAGALSATSTMDGALESAITLAGVLTATVTVTGDLLALTPALLEGAVAGSATASGDLETALALHGAVVGDATASGGLDTAIQMAGSLTASAAMTGALSAAQPILLEGALTGAGILQGDLTTVIALSALASASADAAGALDTAITLDGGLTVTASVLAALGTALTLSAWVLTDSVATGILTTDLPVTADPSQVVSVRYRPREVSVTPRPRMVSVAPRPREAPSR